MKGLRRVLLCVLLLSFFAGCGRQNDNEIDITRLKNTVGEYQFEDLAWDSTLKEVEGYIGSSLESLGTVQERETFMAETTCQWENVEGKLLCEFGQNKLDNVSVLFKTDESQREEFWTKLVDVLITTYGEVEPVILNTTSEELQLTTESITYLWESTVTRHTALAITKAMHNGADGGISLRIYVIPAEKTQ